jgi:alpha-glucosidase
VTIIDPGIKDEKGYRVYDSGVNENVFVKNPNGNYFIGQVWPGDCVFPDFLNEKTRNWWGEQYRFLLGCEVDGFWNDMNEPSVFNTPNKTFPLDAVHELDSGTAEHSEVHNVYGMEMARATREGLERLEPNKRPLVLTRANYAGGQRYAAMWTGDNFASFAHLKLALAMFLNIGICGQPFIGSDVGGFIGNPSAELFSRWLELGVFSPFFRTHSVINSAQREPWAFDSESTKTNREIINRRYEMLPEIYTSFRNASEDGLPIVKPLYLCFPDDEEAYGISDEFLFGSNLLVAPVLDSGVVSRRVYFPDGTWSSIYDRRRFERGWHEVDAPVGKTPVFVRDGTILFTQSVVQSTSEQAYTLVLSVFTDTTAEGNSYFDDGESMAYKSGDFLDMGVSYNCRSDSELLRFTNKGEFKPRYKTLAIDMAKQTLPRQAVMKTNDGQELKGKISKVKNGIVRLTFPFSAEVESISIR